MKYCNNCGVELEENMSICPLCKKKADDRVVESERFKTDQIQAEEILFSEYEKLTPRQRRKFFWELSGIILASAIAVTLIIDLIINKGITWSKYSVTISLVLFVNTTIITFLRTRILLRYFASFISTSILLVLLDMYSLNIGWGIKLGIPFLFSLYFISLVSAIIIRMSKQHGFNVMALIFIAIALFSMCIEGIMSFYYTNSINLHWSIIVMVCIIPIAAILYYIHFRMRRGIDLKRFFHI